ncbi:hypothetical protein AOQ84DRAFT_58677 [Glonium stellatum]|uniref:Uncharacterized protein n=1 Tax=Glonium stellatum TaxID=574774 RepID=A0A8E2F002_9PEZI|nr:hypothetical protein AOQ84DRAFT_58677 [Glonium stellatum]
MTASKPNRAVMTVSSLSSRVLCYIYPLLPQKRKREKNERNPKKEKNRPLRAFLSFPFLFFSVLPWLRNNFYGKKEIRVKISARSFRACHLLTGCLRVSVGFLRFG